MNILILNEDDKLYAKYFVQNNEFIEHSRKEGLLYICMFF